MIEYHSLMIRYGELGLKGKNKNQFISRLVNNIKYALRDLPERHIDNNWGRIMVPISGDLDEVLERLSRVFGIYSMSPVVRVEKDINAISEGALNLLREVLPYGGVFKVESRRSDKTFPIQSPDISRKVAAYIFDNVDDRYQAEMQRPDHVLNVEVRQEAAYIFCEVIPGAHGMPVGSAGKAVALLSGGIDSPVACYLGLKRGVTIEAIYYHSYPFTPERTKEKVVDLCRVLAKYSNAPIKLHVVHFTDIQKEIYAKCAADYGITLMRRFMYRIAEQIAGRENALAIYNGECVAQVASQTLQSMVAINDVTNMPVLRPVVGFDKEEIMALAKKIGTYEISIRPYEDCCTLFLPKYPKIRPVLSTVQKMEKALDIDALIADALSKSETLEISDLSDM